MISTDTATQSFQNASRLSAGRTVAITASLQLPGFTMTFDRDEEIFGEGESADFIYRVVSGAVRITRLLDDGRRLISDFYLLGDVFGLEMGETHGACAEALEANAGELGRLATMEQGMPLPAGVASVQGAARNFRWYADLDIPRVTVQDDDAALIEIARRPIGVIAAIKPWNVPIGMAVNTIAPAFRAGCTVVLKPSPYTPVVTARMGEVLREVIPAGVLNIVTGGNELGQWMTEHPVPRGVSFTGSIATGKKVNVAAAADLKRVLLELGGNDAAIVLEHGPYRLTNLVVIVDDNDSGSARSFQGFNRVTRTWDLRVGRLGAAVGGGGVLW